MWVDKHYFTDEMIYFKSPEQLLKDDIDDNEGDEDDNENELSSDIYLQNLENFENNENDDVVDM